MMTNFPPLLSVGGFEVYFGIFELSTNSHQLIPHTFTADDEDMAGFHDDDDVDDLEDDYDYDDHRYQMIST